MNDLATFIAEQRWFGGKGRGFSVGEVRELPLGLSLVTLEFEDGPAEIYQVPRQSGTDAVHDPASTAAWLTAIVGSEQHDGLVAHRVTDDPLDTTLSPKVFTGEQSNSSIAFGDQTMLKLFRRVTPGVNPDIEIHEALTKAGSTHVARLHGWLEYGDFQLALLQEFLTGATDGWDLALASLREGTDFTEESRLLGVAVAQVHATLRETLPTTTITGHELVARMRSRLAESAGQVSALGEVEQGVRDLYDSLETTEVPAQRIHADLHLGQTLHTESGWRIVDFEGEPARPLPERRLPDSPWRDVAGMLRSFDYAAAVAQDDSDWATRNRDAFLTGYQEASSPFSDADRQQIRAFEADKAVYEVVYEARNRPAWIDIPLGAINRILEV